MRAAVDAYHAERKQLYAEQPSTRPALTNRNAAPTREIEHLVDPVCAGAATKAGSARRVALEADKDAKELELALLEQKHRVLDVHPGAIAAYRKADTAEVVAGEGVEPPTLGL